MTTEKNILEMLTMQDQLNEATNGQDWRSGVTALGKPINWRRCMVMETAELIDSYPWKHWKSIEAEIDIENVRVELVDIWHFLLSLALENQSVETSTGLLEQALIQSESNRLSADLSVVEQVAVHERMMALALSQEDVSAEYLQVLALAFFHACQVAGLSFERLHQVYMAKNVLNQFRQDHGYKEGTYIKMWNGQEDNKVMFEIIESMSVFSGETLYLSLKETYAKLSG